MSKLTVCKGGEAELKGAPDVVKILPLGLVKSQRGDFTVDRESFDDIKNKFQSRGIDIVIDYEHQTLQDIQAPAGGWIKDLFLEGDAIAAKVDWTPTAKKYLENKEYKYLSPVVLVRNSDHKAVALLSCALTNTPAIDGMFPIINSINLDEFEEGDTSNMDIIKQIAALLGLDENTPEAEVLQKLTDALKEAQKLKTDAEAAKAKDGAAQAEAAGKVVANKVVCGLLNLEPGAKTEDVVTAIMALKAPSNGSVSKADFEALQLKLAKKDAEDSVTLALKAGKLAAAQKDWATEYAMKDPSGFASFVEKAPQGVPVGELEFEAKVNKAGGVDDDTLKVCKMMGVSKEDIDKYGKDAR
jgi:phage I-like protein